MKTVPVRQPGSLPRVLPALESPSEVKDLQVRNIIASCDVKFPIRLEGMACTHQLLFSYEPELPGLIYWMKQAKSGPSDFRIWQGVLAGAKTRDQFNEAFGKIHPLLKQFKKEDVAAPAAVPSRDDAPPHALPNV